MTGKVRGLSGTTIPDTATQERGTATMKKLNPQKMIDFKNSGRQIAIGGHSNLICTTFRTDHACG